ncbi:MAG TPA: uroporphyrinogen-III C-methyltransferase [Dehalococcoidia bacterium]|nr:uroporphyrinogen-III C-methyltransferase [Dehalococcoidia bacterium]
MSGRVHPVALVGAGPGDPALLTLGAVEALRDAEVVVYDRLVDPRIVERFTSPACERVYVGKLPDCHTMAQDQINALLIEKALEGKRVVRLKGGDPFVFGRGGEEALALREAGIPFRIVPGVTSAVAAPAYAGIPVTHRGLASSFAVVTGHEGPTKEDEAVDWRRLATAIDTIVLLMGTKTLPQVVELLIEGGRSPETPVAVVQWGTLANQRTVMGTLSDIVARATEAGVTSPAVTVVGDVARLRDALRWFDNRPLFGKRVLITRTREQASELARMLEAAGASPVELPTIAIEPLVDATALCDVFERLAAGAYALTVFTSANGVRLFFGLLRDARRDARSVASRVAAIGPATASALEAHGVVPDVVAETYTAEGLLEALRAAAVPVDGARVLIPRSSEGRDALVDGIRALGAAEVDDVALYRPATPDPEAEGLRALRAGEIDIATFASSSSVRHLVELLEGDVSPLERVTIACIGPITAQAVKEAGLEPAIVAREHTIPGLVRALEEAFEKRGEVAREARGRTP